MAWKTAPYTNFPHPSTPAFPAGRIATRPIVRVALTHGTESLDGYAIIDSGADVCTFPLSFARQLGLDPLTTVSEGVSGIGGAASSYYWKLEIALPDLAIKPFPLYAGFTEGLDALGLGLLGQLGFFDRFDVRFNLKQGEFSVDIPD